MDEKSLNLGQLAEDFAKLLVDVPHETAPDETIDLEEGERRDVTILFLDLVGYTRLAERLDPEQLKFVVSNTLQVFTNQIKKCGGTIEKFVGDAIMALFGRSEAHEDDSRRAIVAARLILDRIDDINSILSQKEITLNARIGINRGLVVTGQLGEHETVTGESINIAQRLEANAPVDGILISAPVYRDVATYYRCEALPPLHVKNKTAPLTVYRVRDEIPKPDRPPHDQTGPIVGRDAEIAMLKAAWARAAAAQMSSMQLVGEAGVGKRALINAMLEGVHREGTDVQPIFVTADSFGMTPYHALTDMLQAYLMQHRLTLDQLVVESDEVTEESLPGYQYYLEDLLGRVHEPSQRAQLEQMDPHARQQETILAVKHFLRIAAAREMRASRGPLVVVVTHCEWMTHASQGALRQLIEILPEHLALLWILSGRQQEAMQWIPTRASVSTLHLGPLTREATAAWLAAHFPDQSWRPSIIAQLHERTGGNPFYLEELLRALVGSGGTCDIDLAHLDDHLSGSIKSLVLSRLDRLPRPVKFSLQVSAVAGREFSLPLLRHILSRVQLSYRVEEIVEALRTENLLTDAGEWLIMHRPMLSEVAYSTILYANRQKLHRLVAEWVEDQQRDRLTQYAPYLASQWERAEEWRKAVGYYLEAGRAARWQYAYREAALYLERVLQLAARDPAVLNANDTLNVHMLMNDLGEALGEPDRWRMHVEEGLRLTKPGDMAHAALQLRRIEYEHRYGKRSVAQEAIAQLVLDARHHLPQWPELQVKILQTAAAFALERGTDATAYIEAAIALRPKLREPRHQYLLDNAVFNHYKNADELKRAEAHLTRMLSASSNDTYTRQSNQLLSCSYLWDRGIDFAVIADRAAQAAAYFREVGWARGVGWGAFYEAAARLRRGEFTQVRRILQDGLRDMRRARDEYIVGLLELLQAATELFSGEMVAYQVQRKAILDRAATEKMEIQLALQRELAMFEGLVLVQPEELGRIHETLLRTESVPLAKVQRDEYYVILALVVVQIGQVEGGKRYLADVVPHIEENEKGWLSGVVSQVEGLIASAQQDIATMNRLFGESVVQLHAIGAEYSCYLTYRSWRAALCGHQLGESREGAAVAQQLAHFPHGHHRETRRV
ncbi:MAG: AAA family ATPase [Deltaproteobacteria bacterium]|nr:AAA family ATPase [Deltaproteobacteria bacterium]